MKGCPAVHAPPPAARPYISPSRMLTPVIAGRDRHGLLPRPARVHRRHLHRWKRQLQVHLLHNHAHQGRDGVDLAGWRHRCCRCDPTGGDYVAAQEATQADGEARGRQGTTHAVAVAGALMSSMFLTTAELHLRHSSLRVVELRGTRPRARHRRRHARQKRRRTGEQDKGRRRAGGPSRGGLAGRGAAQA